MIVRPDDTDVSVYVFLQDAVTGGPYTATGGETAFNLLYTRDGAAQVSANVSAALAAADSAHQDGKIYHVGAGLWRCDFADAAFAAGVDRVTLQVTHDSDAFLPAEVRADLGSVAGALGALNIDSTGTGDGITLAKTLELLLASRILKSSYDATTGEWTLYGLDGSTPLTVLTLTGSGSRGEPTIH